MLLPKTPEPECPDSSSRGSKAGTLYLVPTPLGNLGDITIRAADLLRSVSLVACEDTRVTRKLLSHLGASARTISIREGNEARGAPAIIRALADGRDVAYCTDAGMPGISDPGKALAAKVRQAGHDVKALPGASAVTVAIALTDFGDGRFTFAGFLPAKKGERRSRLEKLKTIPVAIVFYEAPHRMDEMLCDAAEILGDRRVTICREISKVYEETLVTTLAEAALRTEWRGEITIVIEGASKVDAPHSPEDAREWIRAQLAEQPGVTTNTVAKEASELFGFPKKETYRMALEARRKK